MPCLGESERKTNGNLHSFPNTLFLFEFSFGFEECEIRRTKEKSGLRPKGEIKGEIKIN